MKRIAVLLVAAGLPASSHAETSSSRPHACSAIEVTAPAMARQPRNLSFSTRRALDLQFETRLRRPVFGDHVLHFKVFTPSGFLYQELSAPFTWPRPGGDTAEGAGVKPASGSKGRDIQELGPARGRGTRDTLSVRLAVAGTSITLNTLYGPWSVQAFLDDRTRPCSPIRRFTIQGN